MFQTVDLCLRLDRPPLPRPLAVPPSVLGDPTPRSPSVNQWLSQGLQSVLGDQADTVLQEMVMVENFYLIGKEDICDIVSAVSAWDYLFIYVFYCLSF